MAQQLDARFDRIVRDQSEILAVLSSMVEGVLAIDQEQRIVLLNAAAASMLSVSASAARGRPVWEVTRIPEITDLLDRCLRTQQLAAGEVLLAGESHDRVLRLTAAPLADEGGPWGCVLVLHDLTEVRRLEQVRRDFVTNVSHELKTPLTAMRGFVEAVIDDPAMDPATRLRFLVRARENTDRIVAIVGDLLSLARIEAEDGALHPELLDLREVAAGCHAEAGSAAALREISLQLGLPGEPLPVWGDAAALATAIGNLLDNAIKYTPRGGRVRMHAGSEGAEAFLEVADNGQGIPAHETDRIFERFYRVDRNRSRELGGTGLGLSIVKHVVLAHRGRVSVQSTVGKGSTFRIVLPLHGGEGPGASGAAEGARAVPPGPAAMASLPRRTVRSSPAPGAP
jgi:two-component system phosphate regulon sensor histidine kinase PhoR